MLFSESERSELTREDYEFMTALFSDETDAYRSPAEPEAGENVKIRLRTEISPDCHAWLLIKDRPDPIPMHIIREDAFFSWYEAEIVCPEQAVSYCFLIEFGNNSFLCRRFGSVLMNEDRKIDFSRCFRIQPGFHTPEWAKGALQYQIFTDRFRNGCEGNDPTDGEYCYEGSPIRKRKVWGDVPDTDDFRCFYGGDLQGVMEKLDYLQSIGIEAIYFNPLFLSPSSHKYDTQDYRHIDPHFAVIREDLEPGDGSGGNDPVKMDRYIKRVTSADSGALP